MNPFGNTRTETKHPRPTEADWERFPHLRRGCGGPIVEGQNVDGLHYLECGKCAVRRTWAWRPADDRRP